MKAKAKRLLKVELQEKLEKEELRLMDLDNERSDLHRKDWQNVNAKYGICLSKINKLKHDIELLDIKRKPVRVIHTYKTTQSIGVRIFN